MEDDHSKEYNQDQIPNLHGLECVRSRPGMYMFNLDNPEFDPLIECLNHLLNNSIAEHRAGFGIFIEVTLTGDGGCRVSDQGRGISLDLSESYDRPFIEVAWTDIHLAKGKGPWKYLYSGGLHSAGGGRTVNALSVRCEVNTIVDGTAGRIVFSRGKIIEPLQISDAAGRSSGTSVFFVPDPEIFGDKTMFSRFSIAVRLRQLAALNPDLVIKFSDERERFPHLETISYPRGLLDLLREVNGSRGELPILEIKGTWTEERGTEQFRSTFTAIANVISEAQGRILSFSDQHETRDHGTHVDGFLAGLLLEVADIQVRLRDFQSAQYLELSDEWQSYFEEAKMNADDEALRDLEREKPNDVGLEYNTNLHTSDLLPHLNVIISIEGGNLYYNSQSRTKLIKHEVADPIADATRSAARAFFADHPEIADLYGYRVLNAARNRLAGRTAWEP